MKRLWKLVTKLWKLPRHVAKCCSIFCPIPFLPNRHLVFHLSQRTCSHGPYPHSFNLVVSNLVACNFCAETPFCALLRSFVLICALLRSFASFCVRPRLGCRFSFLDSFSTPISTLRTSSTKRPQEPTFGHFFDFGPERPNNPCSRPKFS